ncbi:MAG: SNF2 helicase associated domain-containing protein [Eggerthellaceae bacterium]|nr:SNF2 helicase associated domain-containing protein [Eggerthellaceae bacterium]
MAALCVAWDRRVGDDGPVYSFDLDADLEELVISCDVRCSFEGRSYGNEVFDAAFDSVPLAVEVHRALCENLGFADDALGFSLQYTAGNASAIRNAVDSGVPDLARFGEVHLTEAIKRIGLVDDASVEVSLSVESGSLVVRIASAAMEGKELAKFLELARRYELWGTYAEPNANGLLVLRDGASKEAAALLELLGVRPSEAVGSGARLPLASAFRARAALDSMYSEVNVERSSLDAFIAAAEGVEDAYPLPVGLVGQLKSWQVGGFQRLQQAYHSGLGLLLADSMGLGKTVEVISHTLAICEAPSSHPGPKAVICCPGTLCDNWRREYGRFAPGLSVLRVGGAARLRHAQIATASDASYDVIVTSYDHIWRDAGAYRMAGWEPEVFALDEAQYIKNGSAKRARGAKSLFPHAQRIAMTGTPIENSLEDAFSIFEFITGGESRYLGNRRQFSDLRRKIEAGDSTSTEFFGSLVKPFTLRRTSELLELPALTSTVERVPLDDESREVYSIVKGGLLQLLKSITDEQFEGEEEMNVLTKILRLRQCCFDSSLVGIQRATGPSSKIKAIVGMLEDVRKRGEKALVFTDMVAGLDCLREELVSKGIKCMVLSGSTPQWKRDLDVARFNSLDDDTTAYLVSLKVGGVGLNIVGPQGGGMPLKTVIHATPWWNPAARSQATARCWRLGQENEVAEINLLATGTYEDYIWSTQAWKQQLADEVFGHAELKRPHLDRLELIEALETRCEI